MFKSYIQNSESNSIFNYIKSTNSSLYDVIKNCGAKNYFMQSGITFLMPDNEVLINKITTSSPKESLHLLKQLLIKGTINSLSEFSSNIYNLYDYKIVNPSNLFIKMDPNWVTNKTCSLFLYEGESVPESCKTAPISKNGKSRQQSVDYKLRKHKEIVEKYKKYQINGCRGINPFVMEIANILITIKNDKEKYLQVCELLDNNAIISWYIIMQLGLDGNPILDQELFKLKTVDHPDPYSEYNAAFENVSIVVNKKNWFKTVSSIRKKLVNHFDISLPEQILNAYDNNYTKLLQDEIRFKYRNISYYHWNDIINDLELIDWNYPQNHIIFGNEELCKYLIDNEEEDKFYSGPVKFVKSIYFMYKPLNKKFYTQIVETTKQSCEDPYANGIVYGDEGDRNLSSDVVKEERLGYNVKSIWNSLNELEKEQIREFSTKSKTNSKEDIKNLWGNLTDDQKKYIRELSSQ